MVSGRPNKAPSPDRDLGTRPSPAPADRDADTTRVRLTPGATLSAIDAVANRDQQHFTRGQVAYLIALAYETGRRHTVAENIAETIAIWDEHLADAGRCTVVRPRLKAVRDRRKAARLAEYDRLSGPPRFQGGLPKPASTFPAEGRHPRRFPRLEDQTTWLDAEDVAYLRRCADQMRSASQLPIREAA